MKQVAAERGHHAQRYVSRNGGASVFENDDNALDLVELSVPSRLLAVTLKASMKAAFSGILMLLRWRRWSVSVRGSTLDLQVRHFGRQQNHDRALTLA